MCASPKVIIYAPLIQALIESVCPSSVVGPSIYPVTLAKRDLNYRPPVPAQYVPPKKGRNPRAATRATSTAGASSSARIPRQRGSSALDAPASFTRGEKKSLFKTVANLFKLCQSI